MKIMYKTILIATIFSFAITQSAISKPTNDGKNKEQKKETIEVVDMDHANLNRDYIDHKIFIDEKSVKTLPTEIKLKRLKKYKNSLLS